MKFIFIPFMTIFLLFACSSDDPVNPIQDSEKPIIIIIAPANLSEPLRGIVSVKAEATDNTSIAKIEVFVDGLTLATATTSPVEATWVEAISKKLVTKGKIISEGNGRVRNSKVGREAAMHLYLNFK